MSGETQSFDVLLPADDHKKNGAIFESLKCDVLWNITQAQFFHTFLHSSIFHSLKTWTSLDVLFLQPCSLGATKEKNPAQSLNAVPWLRSVWQSSHFSRILKCLFWESLPTFTCPSRTFVMEKHKTSQVWKSTVELLRDNTFVHTLHHWHILNAVT